MVVSAGTLLAGAVSSFYLWDDEASKRLNLAGRGVHQRTLFWLVIQPGSSVPANTIAVYLAKFTTDVTGNVPSALIWNPLNADPAFMEKDLMHFDIQYIQPFTQSGTGWAVQSYLPPTWRGDIRSKRKITDDDAILFSLAASADVQYSLRARTYVTW